MGLWWRVLLGVLVGVKEVLVATAPRRTSLDLLECVFSPNP